MELMPCGFIFWKIKFVDACLAPTESVLIRAACQTKLRALILYSKTEVSRDLRGVERWRPAVVTTSVIPATVIKEHLYTSFFE